MKINLIMWWIVLFLVTGCGPGTPSPNNGVALSGGANFTNALTNGTGLRNFSSSLGISLGGQNLIPAQGILITAALNANGTYILHKTAKDYVNPTWGSPYPYAPLGYTILDAAGNWVTASIGLNNEGATFSLNADGTITMNDPLYGSNISYKPLAIDISGVKILNGTMYAGTLISQLPDITGGGNAIINPLSGNISPGASFATGSLDWIMTNGVSTQDAYMLAPSFVSTANGNLTQLVESQVTGFTLANPLCAFGVGLVYASQLAGAVPNKYRFDVYPQTTSGACSAITGGTTVVQGTLDISYATARGSNPVLVPVNFVPSAGVIHPVNPIAANSVGARPVLVQYNGVASFALFLPSGSKLDGVNGDMFNATAMNSYMSAAGISSF